MLPLGGEVNNSRRYLADKVTGFSNGLGGFKDDLSVPAFGTECNRW